MEVDAEYLTVRIRNVPNFPKPGIKFKDIQPYLEDPDARLAGSRRIAEYGRSRGDVDGVIAPEARGFIIGTSVADSEILHTGLYMARKPGKAPYISPDELLPVEFDLEYGTDTLVLPRWLLAPKGGKRKKILVVDDVLATGGTAEALAGGVKECQAEVVGIGFLIEIMGLDGRKRLEDGGYDVFSFLKM